MIAKKLILKLIQSTLIFFSELPRIKKKIIVLILDLVLCILSILTSLYLRLGNFSFFSERLIYLLLIGILLYFPIFIYFKFYNSIFRYSGIKSILYIFNSFIIYGLLFFTLITLVTVEGIPRTVGIIHPILFFLSYVFLGFLFRTSFQKTIKNILLMINNSKR